MRAQKGGESTRPKGKRVESSNKQKTNNIGGVRTDAHTSSAPTAPPQWLARDEVTGSFVSAQTVTIGRVATRAVTNMRMGIEVVGGARLEEELEEEDEERTP